MRFYTRFGNEDGFGITISTTGKTEHISLEWSKD